jgi:hypothetical protein
MHTTPDAVAPARMRTDEAIAPKVVDPSAAFPLGLWLVLFAIGTLAGTITFVLYLASRMPV